MVRDSSLEPPISATVVESTVLGYVKGKCNKPNIVKSNSLQPRRMSSCTRRIGGKYCARDCILRLINSVFESLPGKITFRDRLQRKRVNRGMDNKPKGLSVVRLGDREGPRTEGGSLSAIPD
jgi:hypothetical protein